MNFSGEITVKAPIGEVFERLKDAPFFASCVEGVKDLQALDATHYKANFETKIAYMKFKFEVEVEMTKAEPPSTIEAKIEGKPHGIVGRLSATAGANLEQRGAETAISYAIEASITGRLGSLGQPVLKSKAKEMEKQFVGNLRKAFGDSAAS